MQSMHNAPPRPLPKKSSGEYFNDVIDTWDTYKEIHCSGYTTTEIATADELLSHIADFIDSIN